MSSMYPVNGSAGQPRPDTTSGADATISNVSSLNRATGSKPLVEMTSTMEMKKAEIKGAHVSISDEQLIRAIEKAIKQMQGPDTMLDFSVHEKTKQIMVKVLNRDTGEIIREIPQEKQLDYLAKLWEMAGIFVDERR